MQPTLGIEYFRLYMNNSIHWDFFKNLINNQKPLFIADEKANYSELILKGFREAVLELNEKFGNDLKQWKWGNIHLLEFEHPLGKVKPLNKLFNLGPFSVSGGNNVVNKIMSKPGDHTYKIASLPSTRRIIDVGNHDNSISIIPSGNSGNFWSDHYDNQVPLYLEGVYRKINFSKNQYLNDKNAILEINPK